MTPHQGSGAGTAIEVLFRLYPSIYPEWKLTLFTQDAYILATVLGHPSISRHNVHRALGVYDDIRCPISHKVMEASRRNGRLFTFELGGVDLDRLPPQKQRDYLQRLASNVLRSWEWGKLYGFSVARKILLTDFSISFT
jgi:salicylate hydroxylase